jgi:hypothetical protein
MTDRIDQTREQIGRTILADWEEEDLGQLVVLLRRLADAMLDVPRTLSPDPTDNG